MGSIYLLHLPWWLEDDGLNVDTWPGWETRSRGSGGYDAVRGIGIHHTGGGGNMDSNSGWQWNNASYRPIGALLLGRAGEVRVGAAGATNTQGQGGPWVTSKGTVPGGAGNRYVVSIEAINRGNEVWPDAQCEAYERLCWSLCRRLGLNAATDICAHFEWSPGRKPDPSGVSRWASTHTQWDMSAFRRDVVTHDGSSPPPTPTPERSRMLAIKPIPPLLDTRNGSGMLGHDETVRITLPNDRPDWAGAVVVNLTVVEARGNCHVESLWDDSPSLTNSQPGWFALPNQALVPMGTGSNAGTVAFRMVGGPAHLVVSLQGWAESE